MGVGWVRSRFILILENELIDIWHKCNYKVGRFMVSLSSSVMHSHLYLLYNVNFLLLINSNAYSFSLNQKLVNFILFYSPCTVHLISKDILKTI
jgi:hypothetical protein